LEDIIKDGKYDVIRGKISDKTKLKNIQSEMLWFIRNPKKQGVVYNWLEYNF